MNDSLSIPDPLTKLFSRINYERAPGNYVAGFKLESMRRFLQQLGNPHLNYPIVHVAGTKGKGSVSTMVQQILQHAGFRTGLYVSPHLDTFNQRFIVDGMPISDPDLFELIGFVDRAADLFDQEEALRSGRRMTFFEVSTAAAFYHFSQKRVQAAVLEVGLGGRLDSTNVCQPAACIITNISFDHMKQLGNTLAKIASEKAGIIKPGIPVISGVTEPEPADVIEEVARLNHAPLITLGRDFQIDSLANSPTPRFSVSGCLREHAFSHDQLDVKMPGQHQHQNAAVAIAAVETLKTMGWEIPQTAIRQGLQTAYLPGRVEIVRRQPLTILDIAHNPASMLALTETLSQLPAWLNADSRTLIFAVSRDKDFRKMLIHLLPAVDRIVITQFEENPRAVSVSELQAVVNQICLTKPSPPEIVVQSNPHAAWQAVASGCCPGDAVCVAGSAFLIAELRPSIINQTSAHPIC